MNLRKILYIVPGSPEPPDEAERRLKILTSMAGPDTKIDTRSGTRGPLTIESAYEEYLTIPETCEVALEAVREGYDAIIIGCAGDPGLNAVRELVDIPVVGPGETSICLASLLGKKVLRVSPMTIGMTVLEARENRQKALEKIEREGRKAIKEGKADVMVLECMSLGFLGISNDLQKRLKIPVIDPVRVSVKMAEVLIDLNLSHSKIAYPTPKRIWQ